MMTQKTVTFDEVKTAEDLPTEFVEVPEWGGSVLVRGLNVQDGLDLLGRRKGEPVEDMLDAFISGVVEPKFSDEDKAWLRGKSLQVVSRVNSAFLRLSGLGAGAVARERKKS